MTTIQDQALEKMLDEMSKEHTDTADKIHNWLCQQVDEKLFQGILKKGKSIQKAVDFCGTKARAYSTDNKSAMVASDTVFEWIKDYFINYEEPKPKTKKNPKKDTEKGINAQTEKKPVNTVKANDTVAVSTTSQTKNEWEGEQLDMFAEFDF